MVGKRLYGVADAGDFRVGFRVLRHESLQRGAVNGRHASASPALAGMYPSMAGRIAREAWPVVCAILSVY